MWSVRIGLSRSSIQAIRVNQCMLMLMLMLMLTLMLMLMLSFKFISAVVQLRVGTLATSKDWTSFPWLSATTLRAPVPRSTSGDQDWVTHSDFPTLEPLRQFNEQNTTNHSDSEQICKALQSQLSFVVFVDQRTRLWHCKSKNLDSLDVDI